MIVENMIRYHNTEYGDSIIRVRDLILQSHPGIILKRKYTVPFFTLNKDICYLDVQKKKPILGICNGVHLKSIKPLLNFTGRKFVGHFSLMNLTPEKLDELAFVIDEIIIYDLNSNKRHEVH